MATKINIGDYTGIDHYDDMYQQLRQQQREQEELHKQLEIAKQQAHNQMASMYPGSISFPYDNMLHPAVMPAHSHGVVDRWLMSKEGKDSWDKLGQTASELVRLHDQVVNYPTDTDLFDHFLEKMEQLKSVLRNSAQEFSKLGKCTF